MLKYVVTRYRIMLNRKPMTVIITNAAEGGTSGSMFVTQL